MLIIRKALIGGRRRIKTKNIPKLAVFGGFMDSIGGGGWGPIVSSTLIAGGRHPRYTIGSVNLAEFFVALASSLTFLAVIGLHHWQIIAGLILGGIIAAPIAAYFSKKLPIKTMLVLVGVVVILVSIVIITRSLILNNALITHIIALATPPLPKRRRAHTHAVFLIRIQDFSSGSCSAVHQSQMDHHRPRHHASHPGNGVGADSLTSSFTSLLLFVLGRLFLSQAYP